MSNSSVSNQKCFITFDDGWSDNYHYAFPILKKYKVPATIFLTTNLIGQQCWPWPDRISYYLTYINKSRMEELSRLLKMKIPSNIKIMQEKYLKEKIIDLYIQEIKALRHEDLNDIINMIDLYCNDLYNAIKNQGPWLTWDQINEMKNTGIDFGAHTHNHVILTKVPHEVAEQEILLSIQSLEQNIHDHVTLFSYPNGNYNQQIQEILVKYGITHALTTKSGFNKETDNPLELKRIMIHEDISYSIPLFACKLNRIPFL